ncbi:MAG: hypothetical protein Kow0079_14840 [Vicingaceae bacterium]
MKSLTTLFSLAFSLSIYAQTNLVPNPYFQEIEKKVKGLGQIEQAIGWTSPTLEKADLYVDDKKSATYSTSKNAHGDEKPMQGDNYAGIVAYGYNGKANRSYIQAELTEPLEAGKEYCVKFHVSLADISKYACNDIGAYLSSNPVSAKNTDPLKFKPQVISKRHTVYTKQFYWTPVCKIYKAEGGEKYITIGNFTPDDKLKVQKMKRPKGYTTPQTYDAYYYIDNVSVVPIEEADNCDCDILPGMENMKTVKKTYESDPNSPENQEQLNKATEKDVPNKDGIDGMTLQFQPNESGIEDIAPDLDQVIEYLNKHKEVSIEVHGHIDVSEKENEKLDAKRSGTVYKYLVSKGINKERVKRVNEGASKPIDKSGTDEGRLKNMRVEIKVIK